MVMCCHLLIFFEAGVLQSRSGLICMVASGYLCRQLTRTQSYPTYHFLLYCMFKKSCSSFIHGSSLIQPTISYCTVCSRSLVHQDICGRPASSHGPSLTQPTISYSTVCPRSLVHRSI